MKIAIQGHPTRGKEVIQILKDLGGKGSLSNFGYNEKMYYWINSNNIILESLINIKTKKEFILYTLEAFEKEFPFKVGDIVTFKEKGKYPHTIKSLSIWSDGDIVCEFEDTGLHYSLNMLKYYKEMKEERNITLTLDKAKEWYKKGGELKEIALQAFTEEELTKKELPKTWEEFCKNYPIERGQFYITSSSEIQECICSRNRCSIADKNVCSSQKSAEAHLAMIQLEQLRDCWRQGWKPEWNSSVKYTIKWDKDDLIVAASGRIRAFLIFPTREMAEEFLKCFRYLIEKAGDLI